MSKSDKEKELKTDESRPPVDHEQVKAELGKVRDRIDNIDKKILELLGERSECAKAIGRIKSVVGGSMYVPNREKAVLEALIGLNKSDLPQHTIRTIFQEIISACRSLEVALGVAYLGPKGSYHHEAALKHFGSQADFIAATSVTEVFREVERGNANYGVVALENSTEGVVAETMDAFVESDLRIYAEIYLDIHHQLLANTPIEEVKKVYTHGQALAQCRRWLEHNLSYCEWIEVSSTARGVEMAKEERGTAAIGSELAARLYGMHTIAKSIEDNPGNSTRFGVIGRGKIAESTGRDKSSIVLFVRDRPGALYDCLYPFKTRDINLTRIESRPTKKHAWEYMFFVDFMGHLNDEVTQETLDEIEARSLLVKQLGSYPAEREHE